MQYFLTIILTFGISVSYGQAFSYPSLNSKGQQITDFVPRGWAILDSAYGDLNKDGVNDVAIILQHKDSVLLVNSLADTVLTQPRILVLLFKQPAADTFVLAEQSNSVILKHDNAAMDDPFQKLAITKRVLELTFRLFYNTGSWYVTTAVYKFRYQQGQFALIGADNSSFHRATQDYETYSYNFLVKKRSVTTGNTSKGTKKTEWKPVKLSTLKTLKTFSEPFTWEVEKDIYL